MSLERFGKYIFRKRIKRFLSNTFSTFYPYSRNYWRYPELTFSGANSFPANLYALLDRAGQIKKKDVVSIDCFGSGYNTKELETLFNKYGSDKAGNGYTPIYCRVFSELKENSSILEIGVGTNNPVLVSSMGKDGRPGASLRAFRDYLPSCCIYGADIDTDILFSEERIETAQVDQLDLESFSKMNDKFNKKKYEVIIDDGLHCPGANINTLIFALEAVKVGGYIVIEDIDKPKFAIWNLINSLLPEDSFEAFLIETKIPNYVFVVRKLCEINAPITQ